MYELLCKVEDPFDLIIIFEEVRNRDLKECNLVGNDIEVFMAAAICKIGGVIASCKIMFGFNCIYKQFINILRDSFVISPDLNKLSEIFLIIATAQKVHV